MVKIHVIEHFHDSIEVAKAWRIGPAVDPSPGDDRRSRDGARFEAFGVQVAVGAPEREEMPVEPDTARERRMELAVPL